MQCRIAEEHRTHETIEFAVFGVDVDRKGHVNARLMGQVVQR